MRTRDIATEFIELLERRINVHGELHLDKFFTDQLILWLKRDRDHDLEMKRIMDDFDFEKLVPNGK